MVTSTGLTSAGVLEIEVDIGDPPTVIQLVTNGACVDSPWDASAFPAGVTFENERIVINASGSARTVKFDLGLTSQSGLRIDYPIEVKFNAPTQPTKLPSPPDHNT